MFHNMTTPDRSSPACDPRATAYEDRPPLAMTRGCPHEDSDSRRRDNRDALAHGEMERAAIQARRLGAAASAGTSAPDADGYAGDERRPDQRARPRDAVHRRERQGLRKHRAGKPIVSLSGLSAVNQASGDNATIAVVHQARGSDGRARENRANSGTIINPPQTALQIASPRASGEAMPLARKAPSMPWPAQ
jgi:hypothetical protein